MAALQGIRRGLVSMQAAEPKLANLIQEEKDVLKSLTNIGREKTEATKFFAAWGNIEHADIKDICDRTADMLGELQSMFVELNNGYEAYRDSLKEINRRGELIHTIHTKQKHLQEKLAHAMKNKKPHEQIQSELALVDKDVATQVAEFESMKRSLLRDGLEHQFNAMLDAGRQMVVIGTFGKYLAGQVPQGKLAPGQDLPLYTGGDVTKQIFADFLKELNEVRGRKSSISQPRTSNASSIDPSRRNTIASIHSLASVQDAQSLSRKTSIDRNAYAGQQQQPISGYSPGAQNVQQLPPPSNMPFYQQSARYSDTSEEVYASMSASAPGAFPVDALRRESQPQAQLMSNLPYQQQQDYRWSNESLPHQQQQISQSGAPPQINVYQQYHPVPKQSQQYEMQPSYAPGFSSSVQLPPSMNQQQPQQMHYAQMQAPMADHGYMPPATAPSAPPAASSGDGGTMRCTTCGHAVSTVFLAEHRASGCLTHITAL